MKIVFLCPNVETDPYYKKMAHFARLAAKDLDVDLDVVDGKRDVDLMRHQARELIKGSDRPDYVMVVNDRNIAAELLPQLSGAGINTFLVVEGFFIAEKLLLGKPRKKYPAWLGGLLPNDEQAGQILAEELIDAARRQKLAGDGGRIKVIGLSGAYSAGAILRMNGLRAAANASDDVVLGEVAPALWDRDTAALHTTQLLERNPDTTVIWAANDSMALGAVDAATEAGRRPGTNLLIGGIDWSPFALDKVDSGEFTVSVGGHFLDGAWSIVMLFDHHHGQDFGAVNLHSTYVPLTKANSGRYRAFFDESRWGGIKFSEFSKAANPAVNDYDFSVDAVLARL